MRLQTRFFLSLISGVGAPDVMQLQNREGPRYSETLRLTDLTEVAAKYESEFVPAFWKNCVFHGRVYGIPWDMGPCAIFYKRDLFKKYGIDPDVIETWDDYIEAGKKVIAGSDGRTRMLPFGTGIDLRTMFEMFIQQVRAQVFDADGKVAVNTPEVTRVMDLIRKFIDSGIGMNVEASSAEFRATFNSDAVASYPAAAWFGGLLKTLGKKGAGNWGVFRLPAFESGGLRVSNLGGSILVIPDQSDNKEAAWAFIEEALCRREGQLKQYEGYDLFPTLLSVLDDPFFDQGEAFYGGQNVRRLFSTEVEKIPSLNRTRHWVGAEIILGQMLSEWAWSNESSERFLEQLEITLARNFELEISPVSLTLLSENRQEEE